MNVSIPCVCPVLTSGAARHESDTVTLRDTLGFRAGRTVRNAIVVSRTNDPDASIAEILAMLTEVYLIEGIESWSLVDQKNKPIEVDRHSIRTFMNEHQEEAGAVGDEADTLYQEMVLGPLVRKASTSSQPTRTGASTSATTGSTSTRRKRSKPSSTTTSRTDGITAMYASRDGDSN